MDDKKPKHILSTEIPNPDLMFYISENLPKSKVGISIGYEDEDLANYFKAVFDKVMPKDGFDGHQFLDRNRDIEELTKKAIEFFKYGKGNIFSFALIELLYLAISSSSANYFKDKGESNKTIDKFRIFASQIDC